MVYLVLYVVSLVAYKCSWNEGSLGCCRIKKNVRRKDFVGVIVCRPVASRRSAVVNCGGCSVRRGVGSLLRRTVVGSPCTLVISRVVFTRVYDRLYNN